MPQFFSPFQTFGHSATYRGDTLSPQYIKSDSLWRVSIVLAVDGGKAVEPIPNRQMKASEILEALWKLFPDRDHKFVTVIRSLGQLYQDQSVGFTPNWKGDNSYFLTEAGFADAQQRWEERERYGYRQPGTQTALPAR